MVAEASRQRDGFVGQVLESHLQPGVRYTIERRLAEGGTAVAYLARQKVRDGEAAVVMKVILPQVVAESDEEALTVIKKEAVALGRLHERIPPSPHVVRLIDTGSLTMSFHARTLEVPWLALEYVNGGVEGSSLEQRVEYAVRATGFAFDPARAGRTLASLAGGLSEIHAAGIIHRDLSPGNVLSCGGGETEMFKISDFGIARPLGLAATFANALVGTPGYAAPEQFLSHLGVGPHTDIFSLACLVFFMLTGEDLFQVQSPGQAVFALQSPERRSILDAPTLARELRDQSALCHAIDHAIARGTAFSPKERPAHARQFAEGLLPWLTHGQPSSKPTERWLGSLDALRGRELVAEASWMVRHPPGDDRVVTDVAWNAGGQALAVTTRGLSFWDGSRWADVTVRGAEWAGNVRFVERLSATRWLLGSRGNRLFELTHEGLVEKLRHPDPRLTFTRATVDFEDVAVLVAERPGESPALVSMVGKRWLRPLPVTDAALITDVARLDDERWLVVGRGHDVAAFAGIYWPLEWRIERIQAPACRVLLACASRPERKAALAVGVDGAILSIDGDRVSRTTLVGSPDLASVGIDTLGRSWAAGCGRVWSRRSGGEWTQAWEHPAWQPPFVGLMVEVGGVVAVTVDGAVLECRG